MHPAAEQEYHRIAQVEDVSQDICKLIAKSIVSTRHNHETLQKVQNDLKVINSEAGEEAKNLHERLNWLKDRVKEKTEALKPRMAEKEENAEMHFEGRSSAISEWTLLSLEHEIAELEKQMLELDKFVREANKYTEDMVTLQDDCEEIRTRQRILNRMPNRPSTRVGGGSHEVARVLLRAEEVLYFLCESKEADVLSEVPIVLKEVDELRHAAEQASLSNKGEAYRYLADVDCDTGNILAIRENRASQTVRVGAVNDEMNTSATPSVV
ncbi:unnamed protein product, partial [Mesorhabditis belari]|uniref:Uncharacterized protein n=1 Tax=Mesorhabditis belari TaxID=2138241 RepID=A0AAF3F260_9BILA